MKEKKIKIRRMLILFFWFMVYASSVMAGDPPDSIDNADRDWCEPPVDLSSNFPKEVKDQDDLGNCYAFVATSLVENYACRKERKCDSLSAMDAISLYPESITTVGAPSDARNETYGEGGVEHKLLKIIKEEGLCSEQLVPYIYNYGDLTVRELWDTLINKYVRIHNDYLRDIDSNDFSGCLDGFAVLSELYDSTFPQLFASLEVSKHELYNALLEDNPREYLKNILIPKECREQRNKFDYSVRSKLTLGFLGTGIGQAKQNISLITEQLNKGIPVEVSIECSAQSPICYSQDGGTHAIIIKGMRKNPSTNKCEFLFLNSWGKNWQDERGGGYIDADSVVEDIFRITWLE